MPENKHLKFLLITVYAVIGYYVLTRIVPNVIVLFLPFILAALVALIARPLVRLFKKMKMPNWLASFLALIVVLSVVIIILFAIVNRLILEITLLSKQLPSLISTLPDTFDAFAEQYQAYIAAVSPEFAQYMNDALISFSNSILSLISPVTQKVLNIATVIATSLPTILIFTVAFLFSCVFFTKDYEFLKKNIALQLPKSVLSRLVQVKSYAFIALGKYMKGMSLILCITFTELLTGFLILDIQYAFLLALLIAALDALPAIGTGAFLIPWAILEIFSGNFKMGISLFVLYVIILVVRQFVEPKIMSNSFGTYPILTLVGMYVGLSLFGVIGMVGLPLIITILVYMQRAGLFTIWKTDPGDAVVESSKPKEK